MNRNFIFVFILLATLSIVNADDFEKCNDVLPFINVTMTSGEEAIFNISGTLSKDITKNTQVLIDYLYSKGKYYYKACGEEGKPNCPIPSGTQFSITIYSVPVPDDYNAIYVFIFGDDPLNDSYGCALDIADPEFLPCTPKSTPLNVTTSPNPPPPGLTKYDINGTLSNDITENTQLIIGYGFWKDSITYTYKTCGDKGRPKCPVPSGTQFSMTIDSVPVPDDYKSIGIMIGEKTNDTFNIYACEAEVFG